MRKIFTTKRLCRAGIIAALYVALTYAFGQIAYNGILQIRPAEALTILPLFFPEAVPALWVGCMLANLASPFIMYDVPIGGLATLVAALLTYGAGRLIKNNILKVAVGGFFPVIVNAFIIPLIIVFLCGGAEGFKSALIAYWVNFGSLCATEALWVYALGIPLFVAIYHLRKKGVSAFLDGKPKSPPAEQPEQTGEQ
ncbi:MAG: QueT transporter family protein [Clostridia bacterium]|nr:QueT transporter family protein [Clostridia bacterium]